MRKISSLCALSTATAVLCGVWTCLSEMTGLSGWAGFAGCTTYFVCGKHGGKGLKKTILPNLLGVLCGMTIIGLSSMYPSFGKMGVWCAVITFAMCIAAKFEMLDFCPGTFMGCFCTFAAEGEWLNLSISLVIGAVLGAACDYGGIWLFNCVNQNMKKDGYTDLVSDGRK